ncbi:MAG: hypothetical protein WBB67_03225 [bacterium]|jgi:hypothetical protein
MQDYQKDSAVAITIRGLIGGLTGAVIGGALWGLIVVVTNFEIGFMATGIGFLVGIFVVFFTGGRKGIPLQIVAMICAVIGILIGKYFFFYHSVKQFVASEIGPKTAASLTLFSKSVIQLIGEDPMLVFSPLDILWIILALVAAVRIPYRK